MEDRPPSEESGPDERGGRRTNLEGFPETVWDDVRQARDRDGVIAIASLARIASRYWYPVYFLIRQKGRSSDEAMACTEEFFKSFLEQDLLSFAAGGAGKFREFIAGSVSRLLDPKRKAGAATTRLVPLPAPRLSPEEWRPFEPAEGESPEDAFRKNWAKCVVDLCVGKLREECRGVDGQAELKAFEARYLGRGPSGPGETADTKTSELLKRAERRFRRIVHDEVMTWVSSPEEGLEELNDLLASLR